MTFGPEFKVWKADTPKQCSYLNVWRANTRSDCSSAREGRCERCLGWRLCCLFGGNESSSLLLSCQVYRFAALLLAISRSQADLQPCAPATASRWLFLFIRRSSGTMRLLLSPFYRLENSSHQLLKDPSTNLWKRWRISNSSFNGRWIYDPMTNCIVFIADTAYNLPSSAFMYYSYCFYFFYFFISVLGISFCCFATRSSLKVSHV